MLFLIKRRGRRSFSFCLGLEKELNVFMIKLFIFDMGGVVAESTDFDKKLASYLGFEGRLLHENEDVERAIRDHMEGKIDEDQFWEIYISKYGSIKKPKSSLFGKFFNPSLDKGTVKLIQDLKAKGNRVVCGTNVIDSHYKIHMAKSQYDIFDKVYASHLMHVSKPNTAFYSYICNKEKVDPSQVFFIDDMEENIETAREYGLNAETFKSSEQIRTYLKINNIFA